MTPEKPDSPLTFRMRRLQRQVLEAHLARHDLVRSRFIRAAITEKLHRDRKSLSPASPFPE